MQLSAHQKRYLRGIAHSLDPVDHGRPEGPDAVRAQGIRRRTDASRARQGQALRRRPRRSRRDDRGARAKRPSAELVQTIGRIACFFRRNPKQPKIELPKKPKARTSAVRSSSVRTSPTTEVVDTEVADAADAGSGRRLSVRARMPSARDHDRRSRADAKLRARAGSCRRRLARDECGRIRCRRRRRRSRR